jgi:1-acyl-sn-glycerol-3-phosphate acyltransferase
MAKPTLLKHLASLYVQRRLRRTFLDVRLLHGERLSLALEQGPVLIACNHVCWWDAFLLVQLSRALRIDGYCLMDQANLAELPF